MNLMPCRLQGLQQTLQGYQQTGVPLIAFDGNQLVHTFSADDIGIYIIIPKLATWLNISLTAAINLFFFGILLLPTFIGLVGFWFYYQSNLQRFIATFVTVLLCTIAYGLGDVYLAYYACVIAIIPWVLYVVECARLNTWQRILFFFCTGLYVSFFHYVRAYCGIGALAFLIIFLIKRKEWFLPSVSALVCGMLLCSSYFNAVYKSSVQFAKNDLKNSQINEPAHVFWHSVYIGFGLLKQGNNQNIEYGDACGAQKVLQINPAINLAEHPRAYENILKQEVLNLIQHNFTFVLNTWFAKIGILLMYFLLFCNVGIFAAWFYRKPWYVDLAFFTGLCAYAIFPMLTMPTMREYTLGFVSMAALYAIVSINYALAHIHYNNFMLTMQFYIKKCISNQEYPK